MIDLDAKVKNGRNCLAYMLDYEYYCSWGTLQENIRANGDSVTEFLNKIDKCGTPRDINNLVSEYI